MTAIYIIILIVFIVLLIFIWRWYALNPYNQRPLEIKTFDGLDSPYHPSVLFFEKGWKGWKYWMAETPFSPKCKPYRDRNECPSIHVSNDGINWEIPEGMRNPVVDLSESQVRDFDYYSDPQLIFVNDHLELFYRLTRRHGNVADYSDMTIYRTISYDGVNWEDPMEILHPDYAMVSPGITYDERYGYRMWYVDSESHYDPRNISYITSYNGYKWSDPVGCKLTGIKVNPWHIDVQNIDGFLYLTVYDYQDITLWKGNVEDPTQFKYVETLLKPAKKRYGSFYSNGLYRGCLVKSNQGIELFFSADDSNSTYIGRLLCYNNSDFHNGIVKTIFVGPIGKNSNFLKFMRETVYGDRRWINFIIKNQLRKLG